VCNVHECKTYTMAKAQLAPKKIKLIRCNNSYENACSYNDVFNLLSFIKITDEIYSSK